MSALIDLMRGRRIGRKRQSYPGIPSRDLSRGDRRCVNIIRGAIYQRGGRALAIAAVNLAPSLTAQSGEETECHANGEGQGGFASGSIRHTLQSAGITVARVICAASDVLDARSLHLWD